jgi:hypothetical protein
MFSEQTQSSIRSEGGVRLFSLMTNQLARLRKPGPMWLAIPSVTVLGIVTVFSTRMIFSVTHPHYFEGAGPTISRSAAFGLASELFAVGALLTSICILISWTIGLAVNGERSRGYPAWSRLLVIATVACGWSAGLLLGAVAYVNSNVNGPLHELLSLLFFSCQVAALFLDTLWNRLMDRQGAWDGYPQTRRAGWHKSLLLLVTFALAAFFLCLYVLDKSDVLADESLLDFVFVIVEYTVCVLCFSYAWFGYREVRCYADEVSATESVAVR